MIDHRPELAGDRVACSSCHGEYFEPTDPLPGVLPEKVPSFEPENVRPSAPTVVAAPVSNQTVLNQVVSSQPIPDQPVPNLTVPNLTVPNQMVPNQPVPNQPVAPPAAVSPIKENLEPFDMVMEMKRRGNQAVMISMSPGNPNDASVVFSDNLTPDQVNDVILRIAVSIMETQWPDVYQLVAGRLR